MHEVTVTREVDAPVDRVWAAFDDFGGVYRFHPGVERSFATTEATSGLGAGRQCDFYGGGTIREEVIGYEPGRSMRVEFVDTGPFPMTRNVAEIAVQPLDDGDRTAVTMRSRFTPKYGPVGWLMAQFVMKRRFRSVLAGVLDGLERHLQTGRYVGEDGRLVEPYEVTPGAAADADAGAGDDRDVEADPSAA